LQQIEILIVQHLFRVRCGRKLSLSRYIGIAWLKIQESPQLYKL